MALLYYPLQGIRAFLRKQGLSRNFTRQYVQYVGQQANDIVRQQLTNALSPDTRHGLMVAKLGTYELETLLYFTQKNTGLTAYRDMIYAIRRIYWKDVKRHLANTGFFPEEESAARQFAARYEQDIPLIDILGSYQTAEQYLHLPDSCIKVDLEGYYAPFLWESPWTTVLKGRRILVVHPFTASIRKQYERRQKLFKNPEVLPDFADLLTVQAVQSIAGNRPAAFTTWFDALDDMKDKISGLDFDVALIGCGAYGLPLAAHVKRMGKAAIHLAGWTQMLFGIYGNRWLQEEPQYNQFINEYWIRPEKNEVPQNASSIENACYW